MSAREPASIPAQTAWTLTEAANEPYFKLILQFVFSAYFASTLAGDANVGAQAWGLAVGAAGILVAVAAPVLGAVADAAGPRKPWIVALGGVSAIAAASLWFAAPGSDVVIVAIAIAASAACVELLVVFTNAALPGLASTRRAGLLSGLCFAIGQLAGIGALLCVLMISELGLFPGTKSAADRISGPIAAAALVIFLVPFLLIAPDAPRLGRGAGRGAVEAGLASLRRTLREAGGQRSMLMFMLGRALGGDGMNVIFAFGAILAGTLFGWSADELAVFGIVVTMFAAAGGVLAAALDHRIGSKATILVGLGLVALGALGLVGAGEDRAVFVPIPPGPDILGYTRGEAAFVAGAILVASGSGPAIASMRTLMAKIAPLPRMTAYFGLYALVGKATNFLGPLVVAGATAVTGSVQTGLAVSLVFLALGALAFAQVREERIG